MSLIPICLQINCGYARVAIRELTPVNKSELDLLLWATKFQEFFSTSSYEIPELLFQPDDRQRVPFNRKCGSLLEFMKKKWHPLNEASGIPCLLSNGNHYLALKNKYTLANCVACYCSHQDWQEFFPGKPVFLPPPPIIQLPEIADSSKREEKDLMRRRVLSELNSTWEDRFSHTFSMSLPKNAPETQLCIKESRVEKKREDQTQKRKLVQHITEQLKGTVSAYSG